MRQRITGLKIAMRLAYQYVAIYFTKSQMLKNPSILITGGTGSFGHKFVPFTLEKYNPSRLVIYSRDEIKQWEMAKLYGNDSELGFSLVMSEIKIDCLEL